MLKGYKKVADVPGPWTIVTPKGERQTFHNVEEAQNFADEVLKEYPGYRLAGEVNSKLVTPIAPELEVVQQMPTSVTPARKGIDMYIGANYSPRFEKAYSNLGMNPLEWPERGGLLEGGNNSNYWDSKTHKAVREGGDITAGIASAPFLAYAAPQLMPWVVQGLKWRYATPAGWILGSSAELPQLAQAAEQSESQDQQDDRNRLERAWDYAWDNPGKTFLTLAGLQATYNWANNKWGSAPEWKYENAPKESASLVPYDEKYAKGVKSLPRRIGTGVRNFAKQNWLSVPAAIYGAWQFGDWLLSSPNDKKDSNTTKTSNPPTTAQSDSVVVRPYIEVTPDGRVVTSSATGAGNDTITPKTYETFEFDD